MKSILIPTVLLIGLLPALANAQKDDGLDGDYGIFANQQEYYQFMGDVKRSVATNPEMKALIPFINDVALGRPIGWTSQKYGGNENNLGMLANKNVRADLEMDDDQYKELQKLNDDVRRRAADQLRNIDFSDTKNLIERISKIRTHSQEAMGAVLLPHQTKRLDQIRRQSQLRYRSLAELLTSDPLREELKITDRQSDDLLAAEKEIEADLARKIAKLRAEAREKLIKQLKRNQQKQVNELLGDLFNFGNTSKAKRSQEKRRK